MFVGKSGQGKEIIRPVVVDEAPVGFLGFEVILRIFHHQQAPQFQVEIRIIGEQRQTVRLLAILCEGVIVDRQGETAVGDPGRRFLIFQLFEFVLALVHGQ